MPDPKHQTPNTKQRGRAAFSAPGKLFLLGEYAVLDGAPALVAAVNRRARVRVEPADAWHLRTRPALARVAGGDMPGTAVFDAVRDTVAAHAPLPPLAVTSDTRAFFGPGGKLGLGASAAVAAALTAALADVTGQRLSRERLYELARQSHRRAQGGRGSGADVAAAVYGGTLEFSVDTPPRALAWPPDLHAAAVITGQGADTRQLIGRVRELRERAPGDYRRHLQVLTGLAEAGRDAWRAGETGRFLAAAGDYRDALAALGDAAGAGIVLPMHRRLAEIAAGEDAVFKTSGAGGGDLGLVFAQSADTLTRACQAVAAAGFEAVDLRFHAGGLRRGAIGVK